MGDEAMKEWAYSSGAVDCLLDLPDGHDAQVEEILRVLVTYAKTVKFRSARKNDCLRVTCEASK